MGPTLNFYCILSLTAIDGKLESDLCFLPTRLTKLVSSPIKHHSESFDWKVCTTPLSYRRPMKRLLRFYNMLVNISSFTCNLRADESKISDGYVLPAHITPSAWPCNTWYNVFRLFLTVYPIRCCQIDHEFSKAVRQLVRFSYN